MQEQKFSKKNTHRQGGCEGSNRTVCQCANAKPFAKGCVFQLTKIRCRDTKVTVHLPMHSGWKPLQVRFGIHVREMEPCSK